MQNPFLAGLILGLIGLFLGIEAGRPLSFALLGFLLGHGLTMGNKVTVLQRELERLRKNIDNAPVAPPQVDEVPVPPAVSIADQQRVAPQSSGGVHESDTIPATPAVSAEPTAAEPPRRPTVSPAIPGKLTEAVKTAIGWLSQGNPFMKVGIALLFLGVGFLLNYAAGMGIFTLEMRLAAIAVASIAALVVGQRLLSRRRDYGLMLQGAAIGVLYLDIFAAFSLYELLPAALAFALLAAVSALAAALAVLQKAPALAFAGFAGGFLAPVLASSGSGNHVALFSYYAVLNASILGIAWFRSWRSLNLLGFYFTVGIGAMWGAEAYQPDKYDSIQPFLVLFFVFFVAISILYARRQPPQLKGLVDASLLFATPVIAFSMQLLLMDPFTYGSAWSAFAFGAFYIALSAILWRQKREGEQLLVEVFLALGVIFTTLVIPFALGAADTAGAWALEGAGMIWIGLRQKRMLARVLGIVLQLAAAGFWLAHEPGVGQQMFVNGSYLAGVLIAIAAFFSARLYRTAPTPLEAPLSAVFVGLFVLWWYGTGFREIGLFIETDQLANWVVGYTVVSALLVFELARSWSWSLMRTTSLASPLAFIFAAFYLLFVAAEQPHENIGWLVWSLALAAYGWMLFRSENQTGETLLAGCHTVWAAMLLGFVQWEVTWFAVVVLGLQDGWLVAWVALPSILVLQLIHRAAFWPIVNWARTYAGVVNAGVAGLLSIYILFSLHLSGEAAPLPWVPLLNPLDLIAGLAVFTVYTICLDLARLFPGLGQRPFKAVAILGLGLAVFAWLNVSLFRSLHHWKGYAYDLDRMLEHSFSQTSLSILWVTLGMVLVVVATRLASRMLWISGAVLLGAVVLKLFLQDLANTGSLARIISFLGVGGMLVVIGYFSPLPPKKAEIADDRVGSQA